MGYYWRPYVPVALKRAQARQKVEKLKKKNVVIQPIEIEGRKIASSFWGKAWCEHLESFSDFENRLPRGRMYVRNGSVCHLEIKKGRIEALVSGSELYNVAIDIKPLESKLWKTIKGLCAGKIGSMLELLQGRLSDHVMDIVTHRKNGLMPQPGEIKLSCSCPDWANMCKHVAAVLYGVGNRLDHRPELLFTLRGADAAELISADLVLPDTGLAEAGEIIAHDRLSEIFDVEMEDRVVAGKSPTKPRVKAVSSPSTSRKTPRRKHAKSDKPETKGVYLAAKKASRRRIKAMNSSRSPKIAEQTTSPIDLENPTALSIVMLQKQLGLSVAEYANRLGVSVATIYNWQKAKGRLNLRRNSHKSLTRLYQTCKPVKN